jgi:hypothetical protein
MYLNQEPVTKSENPKKFSSDFARKPFRFFTAASARKLPSPDHLKGLTTTPKGGVS